MNQEAIDKYDAIRTKVLNSALAVRHKRKCSCHAMVDVIMLAARLHSIPDKNADGFVHDLCENVAGLRVVQSDATRLVVLPWFRGTAVGSRMFTDSGFRKQFRDGSNQVQHFVAGLAFGYMSSVIGSQHRVLRPDSKADTLLNDVSSKLGARLHDNSVSLYDTKYWIEHEVAEKKCSVCNGGLGR